VLITCDIIRTQKEWFCWSI